MESNSSVRYQVRALTKEDGYKMYYYPDYTTARDIYDYYLNRIDIIAARLEKRSTYGDITEITPIISYWAGGNAIDL